MILNTEKLIYGQLILSSMSRDKLDHIYKQKLQFITTHKQMHQQIQLYQELTPKRVEMFF